MFLRPVVVLQAAGDRHIGISALARTAALAAAFERMGFWQRVLVIWEAPPELVEHFAPKGCEVLGVEDRESAMDWRSLLAPPGTNAVLITDLLNLEPSDFQSAREEGYRFLVHLNDSGLGRFSANLLVDENRSEPTADFAGTELLGASYCILPDSIRMLRPKQPWQGQRLQRILVTFGGADPDNLSLNFLQRLRPLLTEANLEVTAIAGPVFHPNHRYHLQNLVQQDAHITLIDAPKSLAELILSHDLTITLGGMTSYEAMCLGRPCGAIAQGAMTAHIQSLAQLNLLKNLGDIEQAVGNLQQFLTQPSRLEALATAGWQAIDGQGGDRITRHILESV